MKKLLATLLTVTMLGSVSVPALAVEQPADTSGSANTTLSSVGQLVSCVQGDDGAWGLLYLGRTGHGLRRVAWRIGDASRLGLVRRWVGEVGYPSRGGVGNGFEVGHGGRYGCA